MSFSSISNLQELPSLTFRSYSIPVAVPLDVVELPPFVAPFVAPFAPPFVPPSMPPHGPIQDRDGFRDIINDMSGGFVRDEYLDDSNTFTAAPSPLPPPLPPSVQPILSLPMTGHELKPREIHIFDAPGGHVVAIRGDQSPGVTGERCSDQNGRIPFPDKEECRILAELLYDSFSSDGEYARDDLRVQTGCVQWDGTNGVSWTSEYGEEESRCLAKLCFCGYPHARFALTSSTFFTT